jgi:hypothetical protein
MLESSRLVAFVATADADRARGFQAGRPRLALLQDKGDSLIFEIHQPPAP